MAHDLTEEQFKRALPKQLRNTVDTQLIDTINTLISEPIAREAYRDNLLSYTSVMQEGSFKISSYIDAVRYVSFKLMGDTNVLAYSKTFPDRIQNFAKNNTSEKDISKYVNGYNKNKLVNLIYEQTLIPSHILNADVYQKAINTQANLMTSARSEKVRSDAADSLLKHLKPPEVKQVELDISVKEDKCIEDLRNTILELGEHQLKLVNSGFATPKDIAHSVIMPINNDDDIIEGEVVSG